MRSQKLDWLCSGSVIPACRNVEDFTLALKLASAPCLIILFGDINSLPELQTAAAARGKKLLVHLDLLEGVGRDRAGILFLSKLAIAGIVTTKPQLAKWGQQAGLKVIQRIFLVDSESLRTGIHMLKSFKPDAIEVLPASTSAWVLRELATATGVPILAGGLVQNATEVQQAIANGACAVSTSHASLWNM
jgi:glycerol uptake operon antiterminator